MSKKDLFRILLKIFGLYSVVVGVFSLLPQVIQFSYLRESSFFLIFMTVAISLFMFSLFFYLIFRADDIISWLRLDRGFDQDIIPMTNLNSAVLIKFSAILIGGILVVSNLPGFLIQSFLIYRDGVQPADQFTIFQLGPRADYFSWTKNIMNLAIGYVLITQYKWISKLLDEGENKQEA